MFNVYIRYWFFHFMLKYQMQEICLVLKGFPCYTCGWYCSKWGKKEFFTFPSLSFFLRVLRKIKAERKNPIGFMVVPWRSTHSWVNAITCMLATEWKIIQLIISSDRKLHSFVKLANWLIYTISEKACEIKLPRRVLHRHRYVSERQMRNALIPIRNIRIFFQ